MRRVSDFIVLYLWKFQVGEQMGIKWYLVEHSCVIRCLFVCVWVQVLSLGFLDCGRASSNES